MDGRSVVALVPAYNEAERIGATVRALGAIPEVRGVVVVDDGSLDGTAAEATSYGAAVVRLNRNLGKGGALNTAVSALRRRVGSGRLRAPDALLLSDADLGASAVRLRPLISAVLDHTADLAVGDLPSQKGSGGFGMAMKMARFGIRRFGDLDVHEPLSGQRAIAWSALAAVYPFAGGFGVEIAMTIDALAAGLRVEEIPVDVKHRATRLDVGGIAHRFRQARAIARVCLSHQIAVRSPRTVAYDVAWRPFGD
jgi:glycosyltransferase involved in cell wall biosynthesis